MLKNILYLFLALGVVAHAGKNQSNATIEMEPEAEPHNNIEAPAEVRDHLSPTASLRDALVLKQRKANRERIFQTNRTLRALRAEEEQALRSTKEKKYMQFIQNTLFKKDYSHPKQNRDGSW